MYTSTHGNVGSIIYLSCPDKILGGLLAILSHYILDYIGEEYYGSRHMELIIEFIFLALFLLLALFSNNSIGYFLGWTLGNLPDLVDKRLLLKRDTKQFLSCHGHPGWKIGKFRLGIFSINGHKLGYPIKFKLNKFVTVMFGILSFILLSLLNF